MYRNIKVFSCFTNSCKQELIFRQISSLCVSDILSLICTQSQIHARHTCTYTHTHTLVQIAVQTIGCDVIIENLFLRKIHQIMTKAKPFLQHSASCTIWLGPKATGGGFNDRADVQRTCRGMLGDGLKKHSSSLWPGKLHKVSCAAGAGWGIQTHVCNKRQVTTAKLCVRKIQ